MQIKLNSNMTHNFTGIMSQSTYEAFLREYPQMILPKATKVYTDKSFFSADPGEYAQIIDEAAINEIKAKNPYISDNFICSHWSMDFSTINPKKDLISSPVKIITKNRRRGYKFQDGSIITAQGDIFINADNWIPTYKNYYLLIDKDGTRKIFSEAEFKKSRKLLEKICNVLHRYKAKLLLYFR